MRTRNFLFSLGMMLVGFAGCSPEQAFATQHPGSKAPSATATATGGNAVAAPVVAPVIAPVTNVNPVIAPQNNFAPTVAPTGGAGGQGGAGGNVTNNLNVQGAPNWIGNSGSLAPGGTELNAAITVFGQEGERASIGGLVQLRHVFDTQADRQMRGANQRRIELGNRLLEAQIESERVRAELMRQQAGLVGAQAAGQVLDNMDRLGR